MATEFTSNPQYFLDNFLTKQSTSIPKGCQWIVVFDKLDTKILPSINIAYGREPGNRRWNTLASANAILTPEYQETKGCMFCQAIALPGEAMDASVQSDGNINKNAFIRSYVGGGRNAFPIMRMTFLDTYVSFCDSFLRGWALATANFGMIATTGEKNYRTNLTCYKFGITPKGPRIIQKVFFEGICCISVSEEEYNYTPATSPVAREAQFVYHNYSIDTVSGTYSPGSNTSSSLDSVVNNKTNRGQNLVIANQIQQIKQ